MSRNPGRARAPGLELVWPGKYDAKGRRVVATPAEIEWCVRERHGAPEGDADLLVHGDNLDVLAHWCATRAGTVDLAYMDPPFSTGAAFDVATRLGEGDRWIRQPAYDDSWPGGPGEFLAMLAPRIERVHTLLAPHGSLYVHVDPTSAHAVKLMVDEIFGAGSFQREIVWRIGWVSGFKTRAKNWIRNHDTILFWVKDPGVMRFNKVYVPHPPGYQRRAGAPARAPGIAVDDVWNAGSADLALSGAESLDSIQIKSFSREKTGYATQKNESLLRRILAASSSEGELVLDPFCGSGTTLAVAQAMGRRFLGCDRGTAAIQLARARLRGGARPLELIEARPEQRDDEALASAIAARMTGHGVPATRLRISTTPISASAITTAGKREQLVVAPGFELPLPVAEQGGAIRIGPWARERVRPLQFDRDAIARADVELRHAVAELPRIVLELRALELRLVEYAFVDDAWWPDDLRAAKPGLGELVYELAVDDASRDGVLRPRVVAGADAAVVLQPKGKRATVTVQLVDVRRLCTRIRIALAHEGRAWRVESATATS